MQKLFTDLGIDPELLKGIESLGFEQPSPIQAEAIPVGLAGRDVVGQSQTGSGKTMAFGVPALQLVEPRDGVVQVLILCPTRELAIQVNTELHKLLPFKQGVFATPIYGGTSYDRQIRALKRGVQVVVGTPGRVLDLIRKGVLKLGGLKMLVFDEADEMVNMGFRDEIEELMTQLPEKRQTILFSATISKPIRKLIDNYTNDPAVITIEHKTLTVPTIEQRYYEVMGRSKVEVVSRLMDMEDAKRTIIFANTKRAVDTITDAMTARGFSTDRLHGDLSQQMRDRVMRNFREGVIDILVATDVASRGLDVDGVDLIFNYDLPYDEEDYVHRIGRTGRAGRMGKAISLVVGREIYLFQRIQRYIKVKVQRAKVPSQEEVENNRIDQFFEKLKQSLESKEFASHDHTVQRLLDAGFTSTDISSALVDLILKDSARQGERIAEDTRQAPDRPDWELERGGRGDRRGGDSRGRRHDRGPGDARRGPREEWRGDDRRPADRRGRPARDEGRERPDRGYGQEQRGGRPPFRRREEGAPGKTPGQMVRLSLNIGSADGAKHGQIAGAIYNTTGLPAGTLGKIEIGERSSSIDVPNNFVKQAMSVEGTVVSGRPLRLDVATSSTKPRPKGDGFYKPFAKPGAQPFPKGESKFGDKSDPEKKKGFRKKHKSNKDKGKPRRLKGQV